MSTPRSLTLPPEVRVAQITTSRLTHAALIAEPPSGTTRNTALLVPGFTGSKEDFIAILAGIAAGGYRVLAVDQRGQFETPHDDSDLDDVLAVLGEDLISLLEAVAPDEPVHVVGHSLGGLVARSATLLAPDRIASLTLMCSGPRAIPDGQWPMLQALVAALPTASLADVWATKEALDRANGIEPPSPQVHEFLQRRFLANSPIALSAKAQVLMTEPDRSVELGDVARSAGIPVLVMHGDSDDAWPIEEQTLMARELDAPVISIANAGHSPAVDQPAATVAGLLGFWAGRQV